jgi:hypothetical protein
MEEMMNKLAQNKGLMQALVVVVVLCFSTWAMASGLTGSRIIPSSKVGIFDGEKKIGEISNEAPLPQGKILSSKDKFGVKLDGIYLVATENTKVAVSPIDGGQDIFVQSGMVYFSLSAIKNTLTFSTPQDSVTVQNAVIQASTTTPMIRGYVSYENDQMEVAVLEGGQLMVVNANGQQMIEPGRKLMVQKVQAQLGGAGGGLSSTAIGGIGLGAGLGVVLIGGIAGSPSKGSDPTSPFRP